MKTVFKILIITLVCFNFWQTDARPIDNQKVIQNLNTALQRAVGQQYYSFQSNNVQTKGNTIEVIGKANFFGVSNVPTKAVFANENTLVTFTAAFPQNAKSQNIHQFAGSNLLAFAPSDIRQKLALDQFLISFNPSSKAIDNMSIRYRMPTGQMYKPLGNFALDKLTLEIALGNPGASGKRSRDATFGGFYRIDSSEIRIFSTASTALLDNFLMKGEIITPSANIGSFINQIGGSQMMAGLNIPKSVLDVSINKTIISFAPVQKKIGLYGITTFGATEIILQPDLKFGVKAVKKNLPKKKSKTTICTTTRDSVEV